MNYQQQQQQYKQQHIQKQQQQQSVVLHQQQQQNTVQQQSVVPQQQQQQNVVQQQQQQQNVVLQQQQQQCTIDIPEQPEIEEIKHKIPETVAWSGDIVAFTPEYQQEFLNHLSSKEYNSIVAKFDKHVKKYQFYRRLGFWIVLFLFVLVPLLPIYGGVKKGVVDVPLIMVAFGICTLLFFSYLLIVKIKNRKCYADMKELAREINVQFSARNFRIETVDEMLDSDEHTNTPHIVICCPVNYNRQISSIGSQQLQQQKQQNQQKQKQSMQSQSRNSQIFSLNNDFSQSINYDGASDSTPLLQKDDIMF